MQIIHAGQVLTQDGWQADLAVTIGDDGRIAGLAPIGQAGPQAPDHRVPLLLPAPANLHSHAFQRAMAGLTEARGPDASDSFWTWRRLMYRFLDQLTPDQVQAIAAQVFMEMAEAGYGAVVEFHYLHHGPGGVPYARLGEMSARIVAAAQEAGIGLTLAPVLYQFGGCDRRALAGGQARFGCTPAQFEALHAEAGAAVAQGPADYLTAIAAHSLRAVDPAGLAMVAGAAGKGPIHMHLAEQVAEVEEVQAHLGARPAEWLMANQPVDARWCLIHGTQMTEAETRALAATGAVAGLCPITEASLGDGIFPATGFCGAGGQVGFGSDSNIHIALFEELRALEYSQRLRDRARAVLATPARSTGRVLYEAALAGGAQAAGRPAGRIAVGALADLIGLERDNAVLANRAGDALLDTLIFAGGGAGCVRDVWSAGRHVVQGGRHVRRAAIEAAFVQTMRALETGL